MIKLLLKKGARMFLTDEPLEIWLSRDEVEHEARLPHASVISCSASHRALSARTLAD